MRSHRKAWARGSDVPRPVNQERHSPGPMAQYISSNFPSGMMGGTSHSDSESLWPAPLALGYICPPPAPRPAPGLLLGSCCCCCCLNGSGCSSLLITGCHCWWNSTTRLACLLRACWSSRASYRMFLSSRSSSSPASRSCSTVLPFPS